MIYSGHVYACSTGIATGLKWVTRSGPGVIPALPFLLQLFPL